MEKNKKAGAAARWIKLAAGALALSLALGACGGNNENEGAAGTAGGSSGGAASSGGETVTLSMLFYETGVPFNKDWPVLKELESRLNVKLDIQAVPKSDYQSKAKIVLSSDKIPDMVTNINQKTVLELGSSGTLLPIGDYMDKLPNLKRRIDEYKIETELDNWRDPDGKLYVLPFMKDYANYNRSPLIRTDVLKANGLQAPTTVDELYDLLKKLKALYPDSYPFTGTSAEDLRTMFGPAWGVDGNYNGFLYNKETDKFEYVYTSDKYKAYVTFLNKLIKEGLADPEMFTSTEDQVLQKVSTGKSFVYYFYNGEHKSNVNLLGKENSGSGFEVSILPPIAGPNGKKSMVGERITSGMLIPASAAKKPYFDRLLQFVDYLYSDEGIDLLTWGIEGDTYEVKDGQKQFTEKMLSADNLNRSLWEIGAANASFVMLWPYKWFAAVLKDKEFEQYTEEANTQGWLVDVPKVPKLGADQREEENLLYAGVNDYFAKMQEQFVYGKVSIEDGWDDYVKEIRSVGVDKLEKLYNDSLR